MTRYMDDLLRQEQRLVNQYQDLYLAEKRAKVELEAKLSELESQIAILTSQLTDQHNRTDHI